MPNQYVNKVVFGNQTLLDLTSDTVTPSVLMEGYTAHDRSGALITGTATGGSGDGYVWQDENGYVHLSDEQGSSVTVEALSVTQNGTYTAPTGKAYSPVTVNVSGGLSHTVTLTSDGTYDGLYVQLNGTGSRYYTNGATINFSSGDTLYCYSNYSGSHKVYLNTDEVASSASPVSYTYTLPPCNVSIGFTKDPTISSVNITVAELSITANGKVNLTQEYGRVGVNVSGGNSGCVFLGYAEFDVSTTSTAVATVGAYTITGITDITPTKILYCHLYDKAGLRSGYFYGSESYMIPNPIGTKATAINTRSILYSTDGAKATFYTSGVYGVYPTTVSTNTITVQSRYNSSYSKTIDGSYRMDVYAIEPPNWRGIFVATT